MRDVGACQLVERIVRLTQEYEQNVRQASSSLCAALGEIVSQEQGAVRQEAIGLTNDRENHQSCKPAGMTLVACGSETGNVGSDAADSHEQGFRQEAENKLLLACANVVKLREECRAQGIKVSGLKQLLVDAARKHSNQATMTMPPKVLDGFDCPPSAKTSELEATPPASLQDGMEDDRLHDAPHVDVAAIELDMASAEPLASNLALALLDATPTCATTANTTEAAHHDLGNPDAEVSPPQGFLGEAHTLHHLPPREATSCQLTESASPPPFATLAASPDSSTIVLPGVVTKEVTASATESTNLSEIDVKDREHLVFGPRESNGIDRRLSERLSEPEQRSPTFRHRPRRRSHDTVLRSMTVPELIKFEESPRRQKSSRRRNSEFGMRTLSMPVSQELRPSPMTLSELRAQATGVSLPSSPRRRHSDGESHSSSPKRQRDVSPQFFPQEESSSPPQTFSTEFALEVRRQKRLSTVESTSQFDAHGGQSSPRGSHSKEFDQGRRSHSKDFELGRRPSQALTIRSQYSSSSEDGEGRVDSPKDFRKRNPFETNLEDKVCKEDAQSAVSGDRRYERKQTLELPQPAELMRNISLTKNSRRNSRAETDPSHVLPSFDTSESVPISPRRLTLSPPEIPQRHLLRKPSHESELVCSEFSEETFMSKLSPRALPTSPTPQRFDSRRPSYVSAAASDTNEQSDNDSEDGQVRLLPAWLKARSKSIVSPKRGASNLDRVSTVSKVQLMRQKTQSSIHSSSHIRRTCMPTIIMLPGCQKRLLWEMLGLHLIAYDLLWIPFQVFSPSATFFTTFIGWFITIFWTCDIPFSFLCAFNKDGIVQVCPKAIAKNYLQSWFCLDVSVVAVDWGSFVASTLLKLGELSLVGRTLRMCRLLKMLRLFKAEGIINDLLERVQSEFWVIIIGVAKRVAFILVMNHLIACLWYMIGTHARRGTATWLQATKVTNAELAYRYSTSLHWSLTQFTPASMEVVPQNSSERIFNCVVLIFAMVTFSSFISGITQATSRLQDLHKEESKQMAVLRKYLMANKVSAVLIGRIYCSFRSTMKNSRRRIHEKDVAVLTKLPLSLKLDLWEEVWTPLVTAHPFFKHLATTYGPLMQKIYQTGLEEIRVSVERELFTQGDKCTSMFFIVAGSMNYSGPRRKTLEFGAVNVVEMGQWACEAALWIAWKHVGTLSANTHCEIVAINREKVLPIMRRLEEPLRYAENFADFFRRYPDLLTDVWTNVDMLNELAERSFMSLQEEESSSSEEEDAGGQWRFRPFHVPFFSGFGSSVHPVVAGAPGEAASSNGDSNIVDGESNTDAFFMMEPDSPTQTKLSVERKISITTGHTMQSDRTAQSESSAGPSA